jgi:hypothetical protein
MADQGMVVRDFLVGSETRFEALPIATYQAEIEDRVP